MTRLEITISPGLPRRARIAAHSYYASLRADKSGRNDVRSLGKSELKKFFGKSFQLLSFI